MEWDLQDFGWDSSTDHLELDDHGRDHDLVLLDFTSSATPPPQPQPPPPPVPSQSSPEANDPTVVMMGPASAQKRGIGAHKTTCLVDGCAADLTGCRDYHRRHRVCERHSKTPIVAVKGQEKRFCQQCSRFHSLGEFDDVKRSCRKRLDGHNRRRRKSQPEPLYFTSKSFLSGYKGPRMLHFGNPQIYATASVKTSLWPVVEPKPESESWLYSPRTFVNGNQGPSLFEPTPPPRLVSSSSDEEVSLPIDSGGRALYLLSTSPAPQHPNGNRPVRLVDYDDPLGGAAPDPYPNNSPYYALRVGPDSLLEHGGSLQMLPISLD